MYEHFSKVLVNEILVTFLLNYNRNDCCHLRNCTFTSKQKLIECGHIHGLSVFLDHRRRRFSNEERARAHGCQIA